MPGQFMSTVIVLLAGARVGHRALMTYYRQKLRPDRRLAVTRNTSAVSKVISQYKALGWTGTTGLGVFKVSFVHVTSVKHS